MNANNQVSMKMTALYARFSRNDSDNESDSIDNQRKILQNYAKQNGFLRTRFYADDGVTGTTFDRPKFNEMILDIEDGKIDTVIVKDLSRLGRLHNLTDYYMETYFPDKSVRFIAILDHIDSSLGDNDIAPIKNIFNEYYARDTSRKIRATLKNKGEHGGMLCTKPIYGYKKDPADKNHWLIDDEAAEVVRLIFDYCTKDGLGTTQIANILRGNKIPTPRQYFIQKGVYTKSRPNDDELYWEITTIRSMLRNQAYCGDVVNFKTFRKSFRDHRLCKNSPEKYVVFKRVNDPIISEEQFRQAQEFLDKKRRVPTVREPDMFQGFLYCADCGRRLSIRRAYKKGDCPIYCCNTYRRNTAACTSHYTRCDILEEFTLKQIRKLLYSVKKNPEAFSKKLEKRLKKVSEKEIKSAGNEAEKLQARNDELDKIISRLFEEKILDKISDERYLAMLANFESEQREVQNKLTDFREKICSSNQISNCVSGLIERISKYDDITELNQYVLLDLVDKIIIRQRENGQEYEDVIDIYFKGIGNIFLNL